MKRDDPRPNHVAVIGGINTDILLEPDEALLPGTSNPGTITVGPGGVARNIAEILGRLGVAVELIGGVGDDPLSSWILTETERAGVDVSGVYRRPGSRAGAYAAVQDRGDLATAVSDMEATEALSPEDVRDALTAGSPPAIVIVDCNVLPPVLQSVLEWTAERKIPLFVEPVSVVKASRLGGLTGRITVVTPNEAEAAVLDTLGAEDLPEIAHWCVTRGAAGVHYRGYNDRAGPEPVTRDYPAVSVKMVNANGAGDAFLAGFTWAILRDGALGGETLHAAIRAGIACGAIAVGSRETVAGDLSEARLRREIARQSMNGENDDNT